MSVLYRNTKVKILSTYDDFTFLVECLDGTVLKVPMATCEITTVSVLDEIRQKASDELSEREEVTVVTGGDCE